VIPIPAIDLREGSVVQLVGGDYAAEKVRRPDPVAEAIAFREMGFPRVHVVDLDAATGRGDNAGVISDIVALRGLQVEVGGGVRSREQIQALLDQGAAWVVVGTRALADRAFLEEIASSFPRRVVLALDVRGREVLTKGWSEGTGIDVIALLGGLATVELAAVLITAVHVEGTLSGIDADLYRAARDATRHSLIASGGIGKTDDLRALAALGVEAAVIGMALYTGALDGPSLVEEFLK